MTNEKMSGRSTMRYWSAAMRSMAAMSAPAACPPARLEERIAVSPSPAVTVPLSTANHQNPNSAKPP